MASTRLFDIDQALKPSAVTGDLVDLYNEKAVNQSIDLFISNPYRIGEGLSNTIFSSIYTDFQEDDLVDFQASLAQSLARDLPILEVVDLQVFPEPLLRRIRVQFVWRLKGFSMTGKYNSFWQNK